MIWQNILGDLLWLCGVALCLTFGMKPGGEHPMTCNPYPALWANLKAAAHYLVGWYWACVPHRTRPQIACYLYGTLKFYSCARCGRAVRVPAPSTSNEAA